MNKVLSNNEEETRAWAQSFARRLKGGEVIGLKGDLGAGKTTICQAIAWELGVKKNVNSPTFVIMKIYPTKDHPKINTLVHVDAYRLSSGQDLESIGIREHLSKDDTVVLIEWPDIVKDLLPKDTKYIKIKNDSQKRIISLK